MTYQTILSFPSESAQVCCENDIKGEVPPLSFIGECRIINPQCQSEREPLGRVIHTRHFIWLPQLNYSRLGMAYQAALDIDKTLAT